MQWLDKSCLCSPVFIVLINKFPDRILRSWKMLHMHFLFHIILFSHEDMVCQNDWDRIRPTRVRTTIIVSETRLSCQTACCCRTGMFQEIFLIGSLIQKLVSSLKVQFWLLIFLIFSKLAQIVSVTYDI